MAQIIENNSQGKLRSIQELLFETIHIKQENTDQILKISEPTVIGRVIISFLGYNEYLKLKMLNKSLKRAIDVPIIQVA